MSDQRDPCASRRPARPFIRPDLPPLGDDEGTTPIAAIADAVERLQAISRPLHDLDLPPVPEDPRTMDVELLPNGDLVFRTVHLAGHTYAETIAWFMAEVDRCALSALPAVGRRFVVGRELRLECVVRTADVVTRQDLLAQMTTAERASALNQWLAAGLPGDDE